MTHLEHAAALRADTTTHYNCAQSVLIPFAKEAGLTEEQANALAENFGLRYAPWRYLRRGYRSADGAGRPGLWGGQDP